MMREPLGGEFEGLVYVERPNGLVANRFRDLLARWASPETHREQAATPENHALTPEVLP